MVTLQIDLSDVLDGTDEDDHVMIWAPSHREGSRGQVVTPRKRRIDLEAGKATVEVEPGPLNVQVKAQTGRVDWEVRRLTVPDTGPVTLTGLLEGAGTFTYAPPVVGRVALDAQRAEDAADRAEAGAAVVGDAQTVLDARDEAVTSAGEADAAAREAATLVQGFNISFTEDPPGSGLYTVPTAGFAPDPANPGLYLIGA